MASEREEKLAALVRESLGLPSNAAVGDLSRNGCVEWDSLRHVKLMLAVQAAFGLRFTGAEMLAIQSVRELSAVLAKKRA